MDAPSRNPKQPNSAIEVIRDDDTKLISLTDMNLRSWEIGKYDESYAFWMQTLEHFILRDQKRTVIIRRFELRAVEGIQGSGKRWNGREETTKIRLDPNSMSGNTLPEVSQQGETGRFRFAIPLKFGVDNNDTWPVDDVVINPGLPSAN
ncbi:uncharacterized protein ARMOST_07950 [Armillaria ostoyae]|uniref:Uncharacterized protein n=1 Tax=Armillaria ostoyae TaxID=47428 RepID=A0A284R798_ARMOS|nr:uncharacterized protein ARMOST_07950 [Armillaria ostoyae]